MKTALGLLILFAAGLGFGQDVKLREQAERLLEHATAASSSPHLPNLERIDTFRVFEDGTVKEGSFSRVVIQGVGRRDEFMFGDFHQLYVWTHQRVAAVGHELLMPPELVNVLSITPIFRGHFDAEDIIRGIAVRTVNGKTARCISFDTVEGERTDHNEICVDEETATIVLERIGNELIENSDFFPFAGALMPGKITYSVTGGRRIEITQTMTPLTDKDTNVLAAPENAAMYKVCTTFRRPFGVSMPQPKPGNGGEVTDIVVRGLVGADGRFHDLTVQDSERPDLNAEALAQAQQWTFMPAICDGHPNVHEVEITLHFQGR